MQQQKNCKCIYEHRCSHWFATQLSIMEDQTEEIEEELGISPIILST